MRRGQSSRNIGSTIRRSILRSRLGSQCESQSDGLVRHLPRKFAGRGPPMNIGRGSDHGMKLCSFLSIPAGDFANCFARHEKLAGPIYERLAKESCRRQCEIVRKAPGLER